MVGLKNGFFSERELQVPSVAANSTSEGRQAAIESLPMIETGSL